MKNLSILRVAFAALFIASAAHAQQPGTVANHAVPIGKGPGVAGYGAVGPCTAAYAIVGAGASADPACGQIDLTAGVKNILPGANGGTNNGFMQFTGPASSLKSFALPNASDTLAALGQIQTWTGAQSFNDGKAVLNGSSSGTTVLHAPATGGVSATFFGGTDIVAGLAAVQTLTNKTINCANNTCTVRAASDITGVLPSANGGTGINNGSFTATLGGNLSTAAALTQSGAFATTITSTATTNSTLPAGTHTLAGLDVAQTWNAVQSYNDSDFLLNGSTSGTLVLRPAATSGASILRFPAGSTDFSATGGSGQYVKQTSAGGALTVAAIAAGDLPLATNAAIGGMRGDTSTISCVAGVCSSVGSAATAVTLNTTTVTGGTATDVLGVTSTGCSGTTPCMTQFPRAAVYVCDIQSQSATTCANGATGANNGTFTTPAGLLYLEVELIGGGGPGGGSGGTPTAGTGGGNTCWNTTGAACTSPVFQASGGAVGSAANTSAGFATGGVGGVCNVGSGTPTLALPGGAGDNSASVPAIGGHGGMTAVFNGGGPGGVGGVASPTAGTPNTGGGGGGGGGASSTTSGGGGGGTGCHLWAVISGTLASTYTYAIGAAGIIGTGATIQTGAAGATGRIIVRGYFN